MENLVGVKISHLIDKDLKPYIYYEIVGNNLINYLISANIFWGISSGEKYEETLTNACLVGSIIIGIEDDISKKLIKDNITGFLCTFYNKKDLYNYFIDRTLRIINNPSVCLNFKINIPTIFKQQIIKTKEEILNELKSSIEECLKNYKDKKKDY